MGFKISDATLRRAGDPNYKPEALIKRAMELLEVRTLTELAAELHVDGSMISRIKNRQQYLTPVVAMKIMWETGMHLVDLCEISGYDPHEDRFDKKAANQTVKRVAHA